MVRTVNMHNYLLSDLRGKQKYNNDIDTSNVLGLIRETLDDFKSDDEQVKPKVRKSCDLMDP